MLWYMVDMSSWWGNGPEATSLHSLSRLQLQEGTSKHEDRKDMMYHCMYLECCIYILKAIWCHQVKKDRFTSPMLNPDQFELLPSFIFQSRKKQAMVTLQGKAEHWFCNVYFHVPSRIWSTKIERVLVSDHCSTSKQFYGMIYTVITKPLCRGMAWLQFQKFVNFSLTFSTKCGPSKHANVTYNEIKKKLSWLFHYSHLIIWGVSQ